MHELKLSARAAALAQDTAPLDVAHVYRQHGDFVWRSLQRMGVDESHLEDVFQEVFVVVHRKAHTFDGSARATTWLYGICLRVASAWRRRAWVRRERSTEAVPEMPSSASPERQVQHQQARETLQHVLDKMDVNKRVVFVMYEIEELSTKEIATALGVPLGTVLSRLHAARSQFRAIVGRIEAQTKEGTP